MKPIWIVDDDQSIRFVLEKALLRENLATRSFTNIRDVLAALENAGGSDGPQILVSDIRIRYLSSLPRSEAAAIAAAADGLITHPENDDIDWTPDEFVSDWNDLHRGEEPLK